METQYKANTNGTEVQTADFNLVAEEAALAPDWLLAALLRPAVKSLAGRPSRWVIPGGARQEYNIAGAGQRPLITSSNSADARVRLYPFMAVLGALESDVTDVKSALRRIRTVGHYGANNSNLFSTLQFAASTNKRWDLVYAKIDIDQLDTAVNRYVKSGSGSASSQSVQITQQTKLSFGIVQGVETAGTPARPALPNDSATSYYIPLAYVFINTAHNLTTQIPNTNIHEVYDTIPLSPALGVSNLQPASRSFSATGYAFANEGAVRPKSYLPPAMVGKVERLIPLHCADTGHGTASVPPNASTVLDDTIDWRRRLFKTAWDLTGSLDGFPWCVTSPPDSVDNAWNSVGTTGGNGSFQLGNSFLGDAGSYFSTAFAGFPAGSSVVAAFTDSQGLAAGAVVIVYVDMTNGQLKVWRNAVNATKLIMLWLEASGPYYNFQPSGD